MYLDTNKPIASVKYNGVDMDLVGGSGEITITENGTHDVTQYASANVNVQSAPVLLWTNASPASNFAAQTVSVSGDNYDAYLVEIRGSTTAHIYITTYVPFGEKTLISVLTGTNITYAKGAREVTASKTDVVFGAGYKDSTQLAQYAIPLHIWGLKFTL